MIQVNNMFGPKRLFRNRRYGFGLSPSHLVVRRQPTSDGERLTASSVDSTVYYNCYVNEMRLMTADAYTEGQQVLNPSLVNPHSSMSIDDTYDMGYQIDNCCDILKNVELDDSNVNE